MQPPRPVLARGGLQRSRRRSQRRGGERGGEAQRQASTPIRAARRDSERRRPVPDLHPVPGDGGDAPPCAPRTLRYRNTDHPRRHARQETHRDGAALSRRRGRTAGLHFVLESRRNGSQPHPGQPRLPLRPLVEPGRRRSGHGPGLPYRPAPQCAGAQVRVRWHAGGEDRRDDRAEEGAGRERDRHGRSLDHRAHQPGAAGDGDAQERGASMSFYEWYPESRPIATDQGLKVRSKRGEFARNWWAARWIGALERLMDSNRLRRGRRYARGGQVLSVEEQTGAVVAMVQGSRSRPYRVHIQLEPLSEEQWERVTEALAERALFSAQLLAGEMPQDIEEDEKATDPEPETPPLEEELDAFWKAKSGLETVKVAIKEPLVELSVLRRLGQPGFVGQDLERLLAPTYQSVSRSALRMAHGEEECETPDDAD